jgi:hypothetical protein
LAGEVGFPASPFAFGKRIIARFSASRDIHLAAAATMVSALGLVFLQKALLADSEFVTLSISFTAANFIAVVALLGDESDMLEGRGRPVYSGGLFLVIVRILLISVVISTAFFELNSGVRTFGFFYFFLFSAFFSVSNWTFNLRRNQSLMRHDNADFRNVSLWCAAIRLGLFAALAPLIGQYAVVAEIVARLVSVPATSKSREHSVVIAPFTFRKFVRSSSYSTDSLVQTQTLTAVSMIVTAGKAALIILLVRVVFYATGALSQTVGPIFNRAVFQRRDVSFMLFSLPGAVLTACLLAGLWLLGLLGLVSADDTLHGAEVIVALLAFPLLHPLSRLFTATNLEWIKLFLQLAYCALVVLVAAHAVSLSPIVGIAAAFSATYAALFLLLARIYRRSGIQRFGGSLETGV